MANMLTRTLTTLLPLLQLFLRAMARGTRVVEEATIDPGSVWTLPEAVSFLNPGQDVTDQTAVSRADTLGNLTTRLADTDQEGVEYMLLSLTSPGPQG
jgi:2,3-dihydroxybenzoate decarboxylase